MIETITLQYHPKPVQSNEHSNEQSNDIINEIAVEKPAPEIASNAFSGIYQLISSPSTSTSIAECKKLTDFIITTIYRDVLNS